MLAPSTGIYQAFGVKRADGCITESRGTLGNPEEKKKRLFLGENERFLVETLY